MRLRQVVQELQIGGISFESFQSSNTLESFQAIESSGVIQLTPHALRA
jgi:hypothetical protein